MTTTFWVRSAANVLSCSRPRRVVAGQLIRRCRSPATNSRTPVNSVPSPGERDACSPRRLGSRLSTTVVSCRAGRG
jgi:hypothetical protein